ncbi:MAG: hypothetical protein V2I46_03410, partial [Bacteroides sp.]|nr:hypothetical protein [Bacteroides sp.]
MKNMYKNLQERCSSLLMFLVIMMFAVSAQAQNISLERPVQQNDGIISLSTGCDSHIITFQGAVYDGTNTTFTYTILGGGPPALSHWVIALCVPCSYVVDAGPGITTCGTDPTTGVYGLKWDSGLDPGVTQTYYLTLSGEWPVGTVEAAVKAGQSECYYEIPGPACIPDIDVEKTALTTTFDEVGDVIEYAIVVTNTGMWDMTDVTVVDPLTGLNQTIASLPVGASESFSTFYSVVEGDICDVDCAPEVYNMVTATGYYNGSMATDSDEVTVFGVYPGFDPIDPTTDEVACFADIEMPALPEVLDFCGNAITNITGPVVSAVPDCFGEVTYTWTYEDCAGNTQDYVHTVTILPPTVEIPEDGAATVACPSEVIAPAAPVLEDNCGRELEFIGVSDPMIPECAGDVVFTYTYEDCADVQYTWNYTFTIEDPVVVIPADGAETVACPS